MPNADLVVIEEKPDGVFLFRYTRDGGFGGDTWHQTVDEAKQQAEAEFGLVQGGWHRVPADAEDAIEFALNKLRV